MNISTFVVCLYNILYHAMYYTVLYYITQDYIICCVNFVCHLSIRLSFMLYLTTGVHIVLSYCVVHIMRHIWSALRDFPWPPYEIPKGAGLPTLRD